MAKILKIEKDFYEGKPAFLITVDTGLSSDEDIEVVLDEVENNLPFFVYADKGIKPEDLIEAAFEIKEISNILEKGNIVRTDSVEKKCKAGEFILQNSYDDGFMVVAIESIFCSSMGNWLATLWCVSPNHAQNWHF